jgi:hypothetical protein
MKKTNKPLRRQMTEMSVGSTIVADGRRYKYATVRNYVTLLGIELQAQFGSHYNRSNGTYEITRLA